MNRYFNGLNFFGLLGCFIILYGSFMIGTLYSLKQIHQGGVVTVAIGILIISAVLGFARASINTLEKELDKKNKEKTKVKITREEVDKMLDGETIIGSKVDVEVKND